MAKTQVNEFQLVDGKTWNGTTKRNHFYSAMADEPTVMLNMMQDIERVNLGDDFVSMVERLPMIGIQPGADGRFEYELDYDTVSNYECTGAYKDRSGLSEITLTDKMGANNTFFYLDYEGKVFEHTEVIAGMNPFKDRLYVHEAFEVGPNEWRFRVQLANSTGPEDFILGEDVMPGTRWSKDAGLVSTYGADRGVDLSFSTQVRAEGELSSFRVQHKIHGHMMDNWRPKWFYYRDANGKQSKPLWISTVEFEFMRRIKYMKANLVMYGQSNKWANGEYGLKDDAGNYIKAGSGFYDQTLSSNITYYSGLPSLSQLVDIAMAASVGKYGMGQRKMMIKAGEYGLRELSAMVEREIGPSALENKPFMGDTSGRAYQWAGNEVRVNMGQITKVATIQGIEFSFVYDPAKDEPGRNKVMMGNGLPGFLASYQYDIVGLGSNEDMNLSIVRREGQTPSFGVIEGIRGMSPNGGSFSNPKAMATSEDAFTIHYQDFGIGAILKNPDQVVRYYPSAQPV